MHATAILAFTLTTLLYTPVSANPIQSPSDASLQSRQAAQTFCGDVDATLNDIDTALTDAYKIGNSTPDINIISLAATFEINLSTLDTETRTISKEAGC